jgi:hypothetical protein
VAADDPVVVVGDTVVVDDAGAEAAVVLEAGAVVGVLVLADDPQPASSAPARQTVRSILVRVRTIGR